ncbi:unnamed protein product [Paramecium sonneborni]|uniref:Uncharacterized protein n=1 Tax=Paramecium sonneborni TaxID=65129 RepID=A0A8S1QJZ0_9CILI|nr:unnamed protein product [Paramecium sonneborni]
MNNKQLQEIDAGQQNKFLHQILPSSQEEQLYEKITREEIGFRINPHTIRAYSKKYWFMTNFTIELTKNKNIKYIENGEVLRIEKIYPNERLKIKKNIHIIKSSLWVGNTNENNTKIGYWFAKVHEKRLNRGGYYSQSGQKIGKWSELCDNLSGVFMVGNYKNGKRYSKWIIKHNNDDIGGGFYFENQMKTGLWVENHFFYNSVDSKIMHRGEYIKGIKFGKWETFKIENNRSNFEIIGKGFYDKGEIKQGKWIDIKDIYENDSQVIFKGEYQKGRKIGCWETFKRLNQEQFQLIAIGIYNNQGNKIGLWIDLSRNFWEFIKFIFIREDDIVHQGSYQNGKKIGNWKSYYQKRNYQIGEGNYDENGMKNGFWTEYDENCFFRNHIIYQGIYQHGQKSGQWKTYQNDKLIVEGYYDENGKKIGQWIELDKLTRRQ